MWTIVTWTLPSRFARSFGRWCGPNSLRLTQYKCTYSLVLCARPGLVSWSSSQLERLHSEDLGRCCETRFWSDSCLHHCWTVRHIPPDPELLPEQPCDPGVREEVCCSCHAARVSIFLSLSHGSQDLSHACARGPERKLGTFSVLLHTRHRVGESPGGASEHEFDRVRIDRAETRSQSDAACQGTTACLSLEKPVPCDG